MAVSLRTASRSTEVRTSSCTLYRDSSGKMHDLALWRLTFLTTAAGFLVGGFSLAEFFLGDFEDATDRTFKSLRGGWAFVILGASVVRSHEAPSWLRV